MKLKLIIAAFGLLGPGSVAMAEYIMGEPVGYDAGNTRLVGYLAYDATLKGKRPGVLVVHEWWGHNEHARESARKLARLGYTALAVDMYGDGKQAGHPDEAGKFASELAMNLPLAIERFTAAIELLKQHSTVDPARIGAIGYCFGGGVVLQMARAGLDLDGVVSFHGSLGTDSPAQPGQVKARVLVAHGADDPFVPAADIEKFKQEMSSAGVDYRFVAYPGAKHSFTNPGAGPLGKRFSLPLEYNAAADQASWNDMRIFFKEVFGQ
ncbi:MAG: dienelactone hydrolase [Gammaproteobacteria bacterium RBG_16_57_12]|nr:MAG: dienelactone hydrolase [Gammaproteobacteria bacterium RBG_16_57_12]